MRARHRSCLSSSLLQAAQDIYVTSITGTGETRGSAVLVAELADPNANDAAASVRTDGREILFGSTRAGAGGLDLWISTRRSVHDAWSPPANLVLLNSAANDQQPSLSSDGRTLLLASDRSGSFGGTDIGSRPAHRISDGSALKP